ncbi:MAG: AraC family transcriptional regulator [Bacteroidota bacterium]
MERPALIFEHSPLFLVLCIALGFGYAFFTYKKVGPWGPAKNRGLFALKWISATLIAILLVSPIWRQQQNEIEKATFVIAIDNSQSITEGADSIDLQQVLTDLKETTAKLEEADFAIEHRTISNKRLPDFEGLSFDVQTSDLNDFIDEINADYEGRNLGGILLLSDGIHNQGLLPTYSSQSSKIYSVGIGDTVPKSDIILNALLYNQVSYQGNKFPMIVQIKQKGYSNQMVGLSVFKGGDRLVSKTVRLSDEAQITEVELELEAKESGYQSYTVALEIKESEFNPDNNSKKAYIEVIEGKERIALVAPAPHPDIKALRSAIESNKNYSFDQFVLSLPDQRDRLANTKEKFDLIILHQLPDVRRTGASFVQRFLGSNSSLLWIYGGLTDVSQLNVANRLMQLDVIRGEYDQVTANYNQAFTSFSLTEKLQRSFDDFPPLTVPFGKINIKNDVSVLLNQRVGSLNTNKPLVTVVDNDGVRSGLILGSDIWRWKLADYARNDNNELFNSDTIKLKLKELIALLYRLDSHGIREILSDLFNPYDLDFKKIVKEHLFHNLSLNEFATLLHLSESIFKRKFKQVYQSAPGKYVLNKKLEKAADLLTNSSMRVGEVCFECGFGDVSNFTKAFKARYGIVPSAYSDSISN